MNFRKSSLSSRRRSPRDRAAWPQPLPSQSNTVLLVNHECIQCCVQPSSKVTFLINCCLNMCCFLKKKVKGKGIEAAVLARASWLSPAVPARLPRGSRQARAQACRGPARLAHTGTTGAPPGRLPPGPAPRCRPGRRPRALRPWSARHVPTEAGFLRRPAPSARGPPGTLCL